MFQLAGQAISGLVIGTLAMLRRPGPGNVVVTALIGLAGSVLGAFLTQALANRQQALFGWTASIGGAVAMISLYRLIARKLLHYRDGYECGVQGLRSSGNAAEQHLVMREGRKQ